VSRRRPERPASPPFSEHLLRRLLIAIAGEDVQQRREALRLLSQYVGKKRQVGVTPLPRHACRGDHCEVSWLSASIPTFSSTLLSQIWRKTQGEYHPTNSESITGQERFGWQSDNRGSYQPIDLLNVSPRARWTQELRTKNLLTSCGASLWPAPNTADEDACTTIQHFSFG